MKPGKVERCEFEYRRQFLLLAGSYVASGAETERSPAWMAGLRHTAEEKPTIVTYWDYLDRRTALLARAIESKVPNPAIVATPTFRDAAPFVRTPGAAACRTGRCLLFRDRSSDRWLE
jgi:hypothetical protein